MYGDDWLAKNKPHLSEEKRLKWQRARNTLTAWDLIRKGRVSEEARREGFLILRSLDADAQNAEQHARLVAWMTKYAPPAVFVSRAPGTN